MFQRHSQRSQPRSNDAFFNMKALAPRPMSEGTEFDTEFEDDESVIEDDIMEDDESPRLSLASVSFITSSSLITRTNIHIGRTKE